jgi:Fe-S cluster biogenesis protein NfuA
MAGSREEIMRVLREVIGPLIQADGGVLYLLEANERTVSVHLAGRFSGCPGNTLARRRVIEPALHAVAPAVHVTVTSGALVPPGSELISGAPRRPQADPEQGGGPTLAASGGGLAKASAS